MQLLKELDLLADIAREALAVLADMVAMSLAAEALVGADPGADSAEVAHRRMAESEDFGFKFEASMQHTRRGAGNAEGEEGWRGC